MHTLHTTSAFVLGNTPHGENNRVYKLFTKKLGYMFAHGQGVRAVHNRNRFALATGKECQVTLVRGRDSWRITGAQSLENMSETPQDNASIRRAYLRKLHTLCASLLPREIPIPALYTLIKDAHATYTTCKTSSLRDAEALYVIRVLHLLGYVAQPPKSWPVDVFREGAPSTELITWARHERRELLKIINGGIHSATT